MCEVWLLVIVELDSFDWQDAAVRSLIQTLGRKEQSIRQEDNSSHSSHTTYEDPVARMPQELQKLGA